METKWTACEKLIRVAELDAVGASSVGNGALQALLRDSGTENLPYR